MAILVAANLLEEMLARFSKVNFELRARPKEEGFLKTKKLPIREKIGLSSRQQNHKVFRKECLPLLIGTEKVKTCYSL